MPAQFQLSTELTNIVRPLGSALSTLGSLAIADAIKRSGSDLITELKLASMLGRLRIDDALAVHFKQVVAKSDHSLISRYIDIVLESGAGPTVQHALKDTALFSMIVQLSALSFVHQSQDLANMIVLAVESILRESKTSLDRAPDYGSLVGTITACRGQTAAFRWVSLHEAVEHKLDTALRTAQEDQQRPLTRAKRRKLGHFSTMSDRIWSRPLPYVVLKSLLMWLGSLQTFPDYRLLHIRTDSGLGTIVIWCYNVLGLSVTVRVEGTDIDFGQMPCNILVEQSERDDTGVTLLNPADSNAALFKLSLAEEDPETSLETRLEAFGYGSKILKRSKHSGEFTNCVRWITTTCLKKYPPNARPGAIIGDSDDTLPHRSVRQMERLMPAAHFLFAVDEMILRVILWSSQAVILR